MAAWRRLTFHHPPGVGEELLVALHELGCLGVEPAPCTARAYFQEDAPLDRVRALPLSDPALQGVHLLAEEIVPDGRWHEAWLDSLPPIPVGRRLLIVPGRAPAAPADGRIRILLTPGRAFGTGEHATTRACLEMLESHAGPGRSMLDAGTGSGILAIAARLLGCDPVAAFDTDPESVEVAARNARLNGTGAGSSRPIRFFAGGMGALRAARFDLVTANLTGATLARLLPGLGALTARAAILSGILAEEEDAIVRAAEEAGLEVTLRSAGGDWRTLLAARRA
ncbi:MAG TPA: 50S ribosomal protein L11 methyltransferase [Candidatus Polarisedimenticolia bacterium]|nr:50S ribosomal protein L11 methyltransferase [Candidatus Polarisedimenticolia bacterium]